MKSARSPSAAGFNSFYTFLVCRSSSSIPPRPIPNTLWKVSLFWVQYLLRLVASSFPVRYFCVRCSRFDVFCGSFTQCDSFAYLLSQLYSSQLTIHFTPVTPSTSFYAPSLLFSFAVFLLKELQICISESAFHCSPICVTKQLLSLYRLFLCSTYILTSRDDKVWICFVYTIFLVSSPETFLHFTTFIIFISIKSNRICLRAS